MGKYERLALEDERRALLGKFRDHSLSEMEGRRLDEIEKRLNIEESPPLRVFPVSKA